MDEKTCQPGLPPRAPKDEARSARCYQVLVLGERGVGKSSMIHRVCSAIMKPETYLGHDHPQVYVPLDKTEHRSPPINVDGESVELSWTALQMPNTDHTEDFGLASQRACSLLRRSDACVLVCDLTDPHSLKKLESLWNELYLDIFSDKQSSASETSSTCGKTSGFDEPELDARCRRIWIVGTKIDSQRRSTSWSSAEVLARAIGAESRYVSGLKDIGCAELARDIAVGLSDPDLRRPQFRLGIRRLRVLVIGSPGSGRHSVIDRMTGLVHEHNHKYERWYDPSLEEKNDKTPPFIVDGETFELSWTPQYLVYGGNPDPDWPPAVARGQLHECDACVLVYSISASSTFGDLMQLWNAHVPGFRPKFCSDIKPLEANGSFSTKMVTSRSTSSDQEDIAQCEESLRGKPIWVIGNKIDNVYKREVSDAEGEDLAAAIDGKYCTMSARTGEGCNGFPHEVASRVVHD